MWIVGNESALAESNFLYACIVLVLKCVSVDFIRGYTRSDAEFGKKILKNVSILRSRRVL